MTTYFDNRRGLSVTDTTFSTRYRDEALAPIQSVLVGREPLWMSLVTGIGLVLFARQFHDLLFWHEQAILFALGAAILAAGYSIANLKVGQYLHEKTVLWSSIWTINKIRRAIKSAKQSAIGTQTTLLIDGANSAD